jgi:hypothetical protein
MPPLTAEQHTLLHSMTSYIWWQTPAETLRDPNRLIAQVMNLGAWRDTQALIAAFGSERLRAVLASAVAGHFEPRAWQYWHYRLGLAESEDDMPPLPRRMIP